MWNVAIKANGLLLALVAICISYAVEAKTDDQKEGAAFVKNRLIEEVVVTSRKREESVKDVPIAIAAYSGEKLDAVGVVSAQQLDKITPGLVFTNTLGFNVVFLRGVGTDAYLPAADPSVPIYIDDVNVLPTQGSVDTLGNIERVEVLKGPQGTLFGRNALGGAIRIITKRPEPTRLYGDVKVEVGSYDSRNYSGFLNIPMKIFSDSEALRNIAFSYSFYSESQDNYYENTSGYDLYDSYSKGWRANLLWDITANLDVKITASAQGASSISGLVTEGTEPGAVFCAICEADEGLDYHAASNADQGSLTQQTLKALEVNWKLPWFSTKLILSDQLLTVPEASTDLDGTATPTVSAYTTDEYGEQQSAELRIISDADTPFHHKFSWVGGLYYLESEGGYEPVRFSVGRNLLQAYLGQDNATTLSDILNSLNVTTETGVSLYSYGILETQSESAYFQGSYYFLDDFEFTAGVRYDEETRSLNNSKLEAKNPLGGGRELVESFSVPEIDTSRVSPRYSVKWMYNETSQVYLSYSVGFLIPT